MAIDRSFLDELNARNDIVDVVSSYVPMKRQGANYFGLCPFHNEKSPSFSVSPDKQIFHCFGCGAGGGVISFIMRAEGLEFRDAVQFLADRCGLKVPEDKNADPRAAHRRDHEVGTLYVSNEESIDAVKKDIRARLEKQAIQADLDSRRNQAIELLLKKADFAVPNSQVRRQTQAYLQDLAQRAQYAGLSADYIEKNRDQILADAENNAVRQVRLGYILEGIVKAESIEATDDDVKQGLEKIAAAQREPTTADDVRKRLEENGNMDAYKDQLKAEKALDLVLAEAK